jgi:hypothetical protein
VRLILHLFVICVIATAVGLGLTALALRSPPAIDTIQDGAWVAIAKEGSPEIDAYALAALAHRGEIPLSVVDGLTFRAEQDEDGRALSGACSYMVSGVVPTVRLWSLAAFDAGGKPFPNPAHRFAYSSEEAVRDADAAVQIAVSASPQSGDWLPVSAGDTFILILRLYDTTAAAISGGRSAPDLPAIKRVGCGA